MPLDPEVYRFVPQGLAIGIFSVDRQQGRAIPLAPLLRKPTGTEVSSLLIITMFPSSQLRISHSHLDVLPALFRHIHVAYIWQPKQAFCLFEESSNN